MLALGELKGINNFLWRILEQLKDFKGTDFKGVILVCRVNLKLNFLLWLAEGGGGGS